MQREIKPFALRVLRYPEADEHLDHGEDDQAHDGIIHEDGADADTLIDELADISFQRARGSTVLLDRDREAGVEAEPADPQQGGADRAGVMMANVT